MQDNAIIELFFARDERGLNALSEKYGRLCAQIAYNILSNSEDADEAVNAAYGRVWDAIPPKNPQSLCGYVCAAVRNTALNLARSIKRRACAEQYEELCEIIPDSRTVEGAFEGAQISAHINSFLEAQGKTNSDIFVARYYYDMPLRSIAEAVGLTESAVKMRLMRIRGALRQYLTERGVDI